MKIELRFGAAAAQPAPETQAKDEPVFGRGGRLPKAPGVFEKLQSAVGDAFRNADVTLAGLRRERGPAPSPEEQAAQLYQGFMDKLLLSGATIEETDVTKEEEKISSTLTFVRPYRQVRFQLRINADPLWSRAHGVHEIALKREEGPFSLDVVSFTRPRHKMHNSTMDGCAALWLLRRASADDKEMWHLDPYRKPLAPYTKYGY